MPSVDMHGPNGRETLDIYRGNPSTPYFRSSPTFPVVEAIRRIDIRLWEWKVGLGLWLLYVGFRLAPPRKT